MTELLALKLVLLDSESLKSQENQTRQDWTRISTPDAVVHMTHSGTGKMKKGLVIFFLGSKANTRLYFVYGSLNRRS